MLEKSHLHKMLLKLVLNHFLHGLFLGIRFLYVSFLYVSFLCVSFLCMRLPLYSLR